MSKRSIGDDKETLSVNFLSNNNVKIIDRNFNTRHGEIDIIGIDGDYLVFFEVKYRANLNYGYPLEAVTKNKIRNIRNAARVYLYHKHLPETTAVRFDCISILGSDIQWIKSAF